MSILSFRNPAALAKPPGFTHVVEVVGPGRMIYLSGQVGIDRASKIAGAPGNVRAQMIQAFENCKLALESVGASFKDVVKVTHYLLDVAHRPILMEVRDRYVNLDAPPASTLIVVAGLALPGLLFEIDVVAAMRELTR